MLHALVSFVRVFAFDLVRGPRAEHPRSSTTRPAPVPQTSEVRPHVTRDIEGPRTDYSPPAVWTRPQLERFADLDDPEGSMEGLRVRMTPRLLLLLMEYGSRRGGRVEIVKATPDRDLEVELRFFRRDGEAERPNEAEAIDG